MILLLGRPDAIKVYTERNLKLKVTDIFYCPHTMTHFTDFGKYVDAVREQKIPVVVTQSKEMIEVFLKSELVFEVITVRLENGRMSNRILNKDEALKVCENYGIDLRF